MSAFFNLNNKFAGLKKSERLMAGAALIMVILYANIALFWDDGQSEALQSSIKAAYFQRDLLNGMELSNEVLDLKNQSEQIQKSTQIAAFEADFIESELAKISLNKNGLDLLLSNYGGNIADIGPSGDGVQILFDGDFGEILGFIKDLEGQGGKIGAAQIAPFNGELRAKITIKSVLENHKNSTVLDYGMSSEDYEISGDEASKIRQKYMPIFAQLKGDFGALKTDHLKSPFASDQSGSVLEAIFGDRAKINGMWCEVGELCAGRILVEINGDSVVLASGGSRVILELASSTKIEIKQSR